MSILRTTIVSIITQVALTLSFQVVASDGDEEAAARGKLVFETCANCHTIDQGGEHLLGPNLHGIYGRKIAAPMIFHTAMHSAKWMAFGTRTNSIVILLDPSLQRLATKCHTAALPARTCALI